RGPITEGGVRTNVRVALRYLGAWLAGNGCVPITGLMEDAATAEISRSQLWQWIVSDDGLLDDGRPVDAELVFGLLGNQLDRAPSELGDAGRYHDAAKLVEDLLTADTLADFLTVPAYELLD